jgi:hypothetical protein
VKLGNLGIISSRCVEVLTSEGFTVESTVAGMYALFAVERWRFDVTLLDD